MSMTIEPSNTVLFEIGTWSSLKRNLKDPRQSMGFREILTETQFECNT